MAPQRFRVCFFENDIEAPPTLASAVTDEPLSGVLKNRVGPYLNSLEAAQRQLEVAQGFVTVLEQTKPNLYGEPFIERQASIRGHNIPGLWFAVKIEPVPEATNPAV